MNNKVMRDLFHGKVLIFEIIYDIPGSGFGRQAEVYFLFLDPGR